MNKLVIEKTLRGDIAEIAGKTEESVEAMVDFFNDLLKPEMRKNYLSHLRASLEDIINQKLNDVLKKKYSTNSPGCEEEQTKLTGLSNTKNYRPFSILMKPTRNSKRMATIHFFAGGALIQYFEDLDERQKRFYIAHELGHIALKKIGSNTENPVQENSVDLFALIAMYDRSNFYKKECTQFTYTQDEELISEFKALFKGFTR